MIIGLVLCGLVAVLLFFGVAERVFKSFGVAYWLAFIMIGLLIGSAFVPSFAIGGVVFNVAGFIAPVVFAVVFYVLAARTREVSRAVVTTAVTVALTVSVRLIISPLVGDVVSVLIVGFLVGAVAYLVSKTKLAALAGVFSGVPIGEIIASAVNVYVYSAPMQIGSAATFDAVILAAVFAVVLFEAIAAIRRTMSTRRHRRTAAMMSEQGEDFDSDEYKRYFDE